MKAVLFDAAGVLTSPFSVESIEPALAAGADPAVLVSTLYPIFAHAGDGDSLGNRLERGEVTLEEFLTSLGDAEQHCRKAIDPGSPTFFGHRWTANVEMQAFVHEVKDAGFATALVSNNIREWQQTWDRVIPPDVPFDVRVYSWEIGARKPEPEIYELALGRLGVAAEDALFIDDFEAMVDGARAVGLTAIQFGDARSAIAEARTVLGLG